MQSSLVFGIIATYFILLLLIARLTSRKATTEVFFTAKRQSPWFVVAFGMIGASLSGITFISVPGEVGNTGFHYFQMVLGYLVGYFVIALVLLPLYYRLNLTSIYTYLEGRFGFWSYKTGALFFLLSRTIGASFRLFLVAMVLQMALFNAWGIRFEVTVMITILLIWIYTFRGGIKTIVWTDTFQTLFMLLAVGVSIVLISQSIDLKLADLPEKIAASPYSKIFEWDWKPKTNFFKYFFSGAFITIVMTGLDQDMMQKNLTCRSLKDAQKNMFWFSVILVFANMLFLSLGALLYIYSAEKGIQRPEISDQLYPMLAINHFNTLAGILFLLGITAAAYSSADSALTALTTSFCVDFLNFDKRPEQQKKKIRMIVHVAFSGLLFVVILVFKLINDESVVNSLFNAAGYTYGPLLGLYTFGIFTKKNVKDKWVPLICILSPIVSYVLSVLLEYWFDWKLGFEILMINGALTILGLLIVGRK